MLRRSLTAKMLVAVGVTVATVIAIYTYFVIHVQSAWWHDRTQAQTVINATLVHEYLNGVMLSERHEEVQGFLMKMKNSDEIWRGRIINVDGTVVFSTRTQEVHRLVMQTPPAFFTENRVLQGERTESGQRLAYAMRPVTGTEGCRKCHDLRQPAIGAIVIEKSLAPAEAAIASNRNLLIGYGLIILALVGIVLWLLIVRLVTQPVGALLTQMQRVRRGDLAARARAESDDQIGQLTQGFNSMVESLETTQRELHESHEKQIQQAGKLASIGELASGIAHEIRNPLAGIGAAVEVLSEPGADRSQDREVVAEIRQQIHRLNTTLRELLDFARQREPEIARCDVRDLVKPMLGLVRIDAQKQRIQLLEHYAPDLPPICADSQQVQQALLNVLLNAIQAMPQGGTLTVRVEAVAKTLIAGHDQAVRISIQDTGSGITRENLPKIFSPFFTTKHRGTGLGLAITRSIIEKNQGAISVQSEPGRGSTFTLEFAAGEPAAENGRPEVIFHGTNQNTGH